MILRVPGKTVLLRAARIERHHFRTRRLRLRLCSQMILIETFSPSRDRSLSKKAQFAGLTASQVALMQSLRAIERVHESVVRWRRLDCIAGAHSIGIK